MPVTRRSLNLQPSISSRVHPPRPPAKRSQVNGCFSCMKPTGRSFPRWCALRPLGGGGRPLLESNRSLRSLAGLPSDGDLRSLPPFTPQCICLTYPTALLYATLSGSEVGGVLVDQQLFAVMRAWKRCAFMRLKAFCFHAFFMKPSAVIYGGTASLAVKACPTRGVLCPPRRLQPPSSAGCRLFSS